MNDNYVSPVRNNKKSTPPMSGKVRNPFDKVLIENLHAPLCSPGMCKIYKKKSNGSFRWDIDQACTLQPVDIVACNSQFEASPDLALERIAEEANEKFFSQEMVMPSPLESLKKVKSILTSTNTSNEIESGVLSKKMTVFREAQTVLTLPPKLPPELEKMLEPFCTYTQDQSMGDEYEVTANGSFRIKLSFEEHSDVEHYDSEQTDDEILVEQRPSSSYEAHTPILFSPDVGLVSSGIKNRFNTPLHNVQGSRTGRQEATSSSLASVSISPVTNIVSSDEKKNFSTPESEVIATCIDSDKLESGNRPDYLCKTPNKLILTRSTSLKDSQLGKKGLSEKRSLSMSSLNRSRSVQKLDFSMDMSIDGSIHNSSQAESEGSADEVAWIISEDTSIKKLVHTKTLMSHHMQSSTKFNLNTLDDTPIKGKRKTNITHEISKISKIPTKNQTNMSLDTSLDFDIPVSMENKIDFNNIDLKFLTENDTKSSFSFKQVDSGYNENTFYANASSYYESAIKPSELTVTNTNISKNPLKELSNANWMPVDSGFNENSTDSMRFYANDSSKKVTGLQNDEFDRIFIQNTKAVSMSDIFSEDLTFNCNFSSTPSKNKPRKFNS